MKDFDKKIFWATNFIAPWLIASYFYNKDGNWINIIIPVYCIVYWFCAITYLSHHK